ncbi:MAG: FTR1 family protein [Candidatus Peribacteraceae bacterium]|nr:FTR1 family protein [Candidatus Peribacteraceae bacterium]
MTISLLISFRETLEASLVIGIILAYLRKTQNGNHEKFVWTGVGAGVVFSLILAYVFDRLLGGFTGIAEEIYEGVTMFVAAGLLSWMIVWMMRQSAGMKRTIEQKVETHVTRDHPIGLMFLAFLSVAREGIETVIFLKAAFLQAQSAYSSTGAVLGIMLAIAASYLLFKGMKYLPIKSFFRISSIILILFAAGLAAHGVHEFIEAGLLPESMALWNLTAHPIFSADAPVGSLLKAIFGYNDEMTLLEGIVYILYIVAVGLVWNRIRRAGKSQTL